MVFVRKFSRRHREADCSDADYKLEKEEVQKLNDIKIKEVNYVRSDFMLQ